MRRLPLIILGLCVVALTTPVPSTRVQQVALPRVVASLSPVGSSETIAKIASEARWYMAVGEQTRVRVAARSSSRAVRFRTDAEIEACIVEREHGGSYSRGDNPTHTGKYQFSYDTWVANGGDPNTWENASPEEQERVFRTTVERNGYRDWTPYDGCGR